MSCMPRSIKLTHTLSPCVNKQHPSQHSKSFALHWINCQIDLQCVFPLGAAGQHKMIIFIAFSSHVFLITERVSDSGHENPQSQFVFPRECFSLSLALSFFKVLIKAFDLEIRREHKITDVFRRQKQKWLSALPGSDRPVYCCFFFTKIKKRKEKQADLQ